METNNHLSEDEELEDFVAILDQVRVNLEVGREEIRPCKSFPKGAAIIARQN